MNEEVIIAEILEQLSDQKIHRRVEILQHLKDLLRGNEEPHIDIKFGFALSKLLKLNYINRNEKGKYSITPLGIRVLGVNREDLYKQIKAYREVNEKSSKLVYEIFKEANEMFLRKNINSIERDVAEECLCSSLSKCIEEVMKKKNIIGYYADVNYNRNEYMYKTIINDKCEIIRINCDLIVHSRGKNKIQDNLLALEMKKKNNSKEREENKQRLKIMTKNTYYGEVIFEELPRHICRYALGIFYDIDKDKREIEMEFYKNGVIAWQEKVKYNKYGNIEQTDKNEKV